MEQMADLLAVLQDICAEVRQVTDVLNFGHEKLDLLEQAVQRILHTSKVESAYFHALNRSARLEVANSHVCAGLLHQVMTHIVGNC